MKVDQRHEAGNMAGSVSLRTQTWLADHLGPNCRHLRAPASRARVRRQVEGWRDAVEVSRPAEIVVLNDDGHNRLIIACDCEYTISPSHYQNVALHLLAGDRKVIGLSGNDRVFSGNRR